MTKFIILNGAEAWSLFNDQPVKVYINQVPYTLCTDECYKDIQDESIDKMDEQDEPNYIKDMVVINNKLKDLSERVETLEKQMKEDREEQLKKLKAELDYAKFRCALPNIMDMMQKVKV